ncbi:MAG TPA: GatB/YqeY domain-containing protein [Agitococcus sp.]|uniref:GatB/YqeY domain-containing protein n=1 Tax=uncultured Agitococcus sp. TaxID=1506599 RepID=UPI002637EE37|nr:GatB/YqeY domain-containing protein [uncultured Agitococcus sp.]HNA20396.1 GatB/YqeY domain-containing protein [Agitococcus sp.]
MTLKAQLTDAMKEAMRAKDSARLGVIRMALAAFKQIEVDERIELDEARSLAVLEKLIKQRRESVSAFTAANRDDLAAQEKAEIAVLEVFLPAPFSAEEIEALINAAVAEVGATSARDMGKVMNILRPQIAGRADGAEVSKLVKAKLG